ncbi:alpha/beta hydrolase family protein [Roseibacillus persicicus]|uniref:AB hydrolase-1 domain-containing protein n=1 Tax=Roseibacillus persicicus TaxID=454148 RepID=A0A918WRD5_9BACT|nr:alpha/beta fold hydrolase [Roseibacillus persicicus]GHC67264.1 hypothetical protein GCM10007100_39160 [Roseibacillus persicicus]
MKRRYFTIPLILAALVLLIFIQSASNRITSPDRARLRDRHYEILAAPAEHGMEITSHTAPDGTPYLLCQGLPATGEKGRTLRGQLQQRQVPLASDPAAILLLHGHGSRRESQLAIAERFCAAGFTCLLPDLPGHGQHPDPTATFGKREVPLLLRLLAHARAKHQIPEKVGLFGLSQGGAIALQLAAADPQQFTAVASLSSFAHLKKVMTTTAERKSPALAALVPAVQLNLRLQHRFDPNEISPARAAQKISIPTFLAHGAKDSFVPATHAQTISNSLPDTTPRSLHIVPHATHGNVLLLGHEIYADLTEFFLLSEPS